jgi:CheY-like chemotaxis protein
MKQISALIVDDSEIDRYILKRQLKEAGVIDVFESDDGSSALAFLENHEENCKIHNKKFPPEIIFLDINMPIVGGFEFLEKFAELRNRLALEPCVIMMYSSSERAEDKEKASNYNFVKGYLTKGEMDIRELKDKIEVLYPTN